MARIYEHVPLPKINSTSISATAHATFESLDAMEQYLLKYSNPTRQIVSGGTIAYVAVENWAEEVRLLLDKSLAYPGGLFLMWTTTYRGGQISRDVLKKVQEAFEQAVTKLELTFPKPTL